jgi:hypothetical protein
MTDIHTGSCLCGAVHFKATGQLRGVVYCHCSQCRKQTGHYYAATNVPDENLVIEGPDNITWYRSSDFAERGFCRTCGSALFWKRHDHHYTSVLAGLFDNPTGLTEDCHIFLADKGDYYSVGEGLPKFEKSSPSVKVAES